MLSITHCFRVCFVLSRFNLSPNDRYMEYCALEAVRRQLLNLVISKIMAKIHNSTGIKLNIFSRKKWYLCNRDELWQWIIGGPQYIKLQLFFFFFSNPHLYKLDDIYQM